MPGARAPSVHVEARTASLNAGSSVNEAASAYVVRRLASFFKVSLLNFDHPFHTQFGKLCCFKQCQEGATEKSDCVPRIGCDYL